MLSVVLIGTGNVAHHLFRAFQTTDVVEIVQVFGRDEGSLNSFLGEVEIASDFDAIKDADVYLLAVSDKAIGTISEKLKYKTGLVAHTSGATDMNLILSQNRGVFYPLQTFSKDRNVDFVGIPICVEAENREGVEILEKLGQAISNQVFEIDSHQRKKLHLAAVFVNNFTNHLYQIGAEICKEEGLPFDILKPLVLETAQKVMDLSPLEAQTGPAKRGDNESIKAHLELLKDKNQTELYALLSKAIKKTYEEKL
ncbi:Rossmann-like and DUF2520 domain-containing protein [Flagellimonas allohymeniacidonis]|uniref:DUF2520 domain-containing protein n=1 Tax=Flagellimonas allohymeniacidonis TaxID=2517819 RepID=A0A4Q8QDZ5_9FLAO|nr:Rossmann-like and DUF2520 domain-containing protein [Allomuricauda hymeniacidonis]TAI48631.1 DUF2520 domain-containing protein [Allomuricauda hymeniacidonis]